MPVTTACPASDGGRYSIRDPLPMAEMNSTPLIDVMLVLLIMFIITVPTQTHRVGVNLPKADISLAIRPQSNELQMSAEGSLSWNGKRIDDAQLEAALHEIVAMPEPAEVHFRPDASARYERVDEVLAIASKSGTTTFGFVGNERYQGNF